MDYIFRLKTALRIVSEDPTIFSCLPLYAIKHSHIKITERQFWFPADCPFLVFHLIIMNAVRLVNAIPRPSFQHIL